MPRLFLAQKCPGRPCRAGPGEVEKAPPYIHQLKAGALTLGEAMQARYDMHVKAPALPSGRFAAVDYSCFREGSVLASSVATA